MAILQPTAPNPVVDLFRTAVPLLSALVGAGVALLAAHISAKRDQQTALRVAVVAKQVEAIEGISSRLFKVMAGESLSDSDWESYIVQSTWLPSPLRDGCLGLLLNKQDPDKATMLYSACLEWVSSLRKGDHT